MEYVGSLQADAATRAGLVDLGAAWFVVLISIGGYCGVRMAMRRAEETRAGYRTLFDGPRNLPRLDERTGEVVEPPRPR